MHSGDGATDDKWPTTLRFSRQMGELHRGAGYAEAIEGPYRRFRAFGWTRASAGLLWILLVGIAGQAGLLVLTADAASRVPVATAATAEEKPGATHANQTGNARSPSDLR
jgi:hypothetical protein